jgi:hypothetical protein
VFAAASAPCGEDRGRLGRGVPWDDAPNSPSKFLRERSRRIVPAVAAGWNAPRQCRIGRFR